MITIELEGKPIPLHRPRACKRGAFIQMYNDQEPIMNEYRWLIKGMFNAPIYTVPMRIGVTFFMPIPKATPKARRAEMLANILRPMSRPDLDNLLKFILDCMNGIVYEDDSQICELGIIEKRFGLEPKTVVRIEPLLHSKLVETTNESDLGDS